MRRPAYCEGTGGGAQGRAWGWARTAVHRGAGGGASRGQSQLAARRSPTTPNAGPTPPPRFPSPLLTTYPPIPPHPTAAASRRRQVEDAAARSGPAPTGSSLPVVGVSDVEAIVAAWTGVPVERLTEDEAQRVATLVGGRPVRSGPARTGHFDSGCARRGATAPHPPCAHALRAAPAPACAPFQPPSTPLPAQSLPQTPRPSGRRPEAARDRPGGRRGHGGGRARARALRAARPQPPRGGAHVCGAHGRGQDGAGAGAGGPLLRQPGEDELGYCLAFI